MKPARYLMVFAGTVAFVTACNDAPTQAERAGGHVRADASKAHVANRMAFMGQLHNALMDDYRRNLRRRSKTFAAPCTGVMSWFKSTPLATTLREGLSADQVSDLALRAAAGTRHCGEVAARLLKARRSRIKPAVSLATEGDTISDAAASLLLQVRSLSANATSANGLDSDLDPIISSAYSLDQVSADAVLSAAAVASSSAHYWEASYVDAAVALLPASEGGGCEVDCLPGEWETTFRSNLRPPYFREAMFNPLTPTGQGCLAQLIASTGGWSDIAKADMWGAIGAVVLEKQFEWRGFVTITSLASASQMSWHQLALVACYVL